MNALAWSMLLLEAGPYILIVSIFLLAVTLFRLGRKR